MSADVTSVIRESQTLVIAVPSAYVQQSLAGLKPSDWQNKKVVSAIKGLLPEKNILLNYFLEQECDVLCTKFF